MPWKATIFDGATVTKVFDGLDEAIAWIEQHHLKVPEWLKKDLRDPQTWAVQVRPEGERGFRIERMTCSHGTHHTEED